MNIAPDNDLLSDANTLVYGRRFAAQTQPDSTAERYIFVKDTDYLNEIRYDGIAMRNCAVTNEAGKSGQRPAGMDGQSLADLFGTADNALEGRNHWLTIAGGHLLVFDTWAFNCCRGACLSRARGGWESLRPSGERRGSGRFMADPRGLWRIAALTPGL